MISKNIAIVSVIIFPISEIYLSIKRRAQADEGHICDQGSHKVIWITILTSIILAIVCHAAISLPPLIANKVELNILATLFVLSGMAFRWISISMLGRHFTVNVTILNDHQLVEKGFYKWIRHPSYTGLLVSFLGCGLPFNNILSLVVLLVPITWVFAKRIKLEETLLFDAFGQDYEAYCKRTWKLFPCIW